MLRAPSRRTDLKKASVCSPTMLACSAYAWTWRVKRGEIVNLGGLWLEGHGLSEGPVVLGPSSRVRRAAPSLQMQSGEPVEASCSLAKTAGHFGHADRAAVAQLRQYDGAVERTRRQRLVGEGVHHCEGRGKPL